MDWWFIIVIDMLAKVKDGGWYVELIQDPENENHFYEYWEDRCVSDYDISEIEIINEENNP